MRAFTTQRMLYNSIRNTAFKRFSTVRTSSIMVPRVATKVVGLTMATSLGIAAPWIYNSKNLIYNDAILDVNRNPSLSTVSAQETGLPSQARVQRKSRLNGYLDYRQLCIGSIFGLVLGVVVGKISTLLVYVSVIGFLSLQWLQNRGIVDKDATGSLFSKYIIKTGRETIDFNTLIWERPSFKISFLLTFLLAAANI